MKTAKTPRLVDLRVDVVEFLLTEWLRRQGLLAAFKSNCNLAESSQASFKTVLRRRIQKALLSTNFSAEDLVSISFVFSKTPEGFNFWSDVASAWRCYFLNFRESL